MKISDNILVGVSVPRFCEFYSDIKMYINSLLDKNKTIDDNNELVGLIITNDDSYVYEKYFIDINDIIYLYSYKVSITNKNIIWDITKTINTEDMIKLIKNEKYVFDVNYYISNK